MENERPKIKEFLDSLGIQQKYLAEKIGISEPLLRYHMRGGQGLPPKLQAKANDTFHEMALKLLEYERNHR